MQGYGLVLREQGSLVLTRRCLLSDKIPRTVGFPDSSKASWGKLSGKVCTISTMYEVLSHLVVSKNPSIMYIPA